MKTPKLTPLIVTYYPSVVFSFLLEASQGGRSVLLDCGPSIVDKLLALKKDILQVRDIFISHVHGDHSSGLPLLFYSQYVTRSNRGFSSHELISVRLHSIPPVASQLTDIVAQLYPSAFARLKEQNFIITENNLEIGKRYELNNGSYLTADLVCHSVPALGARIEIPSAGKTIAFSGDTRSCDTMVALAQEADFLIHDAFSTSECADFAHQAGHSTAEDAARVAQQARVGTLILSNYWSQCRGSEQALVEEASRVFGGHVMLAEDLQTIDLE